MKFGLALPYNITLQFARLAKTAEALGWDGVFLGDAIWCEDPLIALAAAAPATSRIRLGALVIPVPLRRPWKIASEAVALDHLSNGRLVLGLGAGAAWMGWQAFPDEVTEGRKRAGMLEETIDILTLLFRGKQFDYDGEHFHVKLTRLDEIYYPPKPVQQPRIPLWAPAAWPRERSLQRALQCDGLIAEMKNPDGSPGEVTPEVVAQICSYVRAHRPPEAPFEIVVIGKTPPEAGPENMKAWAEAGATWWIEDLFGATIEAAEERIRWGPPSV